MKHTSLIWLVAASMFGATGLSAAEIQLRTECRVSAPLVRLEDVAEIYAADATQRTALAGIELFPAPAAGGKRYARFREIQEVLLARGINLHEHRLSGASQVEIVAASLPAGDTPLKIATPAMERHAVEAVRAAILEYLAGQAEGKEPYEVKLLLDDSQIRAIEAVGCKFSIAGGASPWTGSQQFTITLPATPQPRRFRLDAEINLPPEVVVMARSVPRGGIVQAEDVVVQRNKAAAIAGTTDLCSRLEDVVGKETTRTVSAGQQVQRDYVRQPLCVRRGDAVTVFARSSGMCVRTTARANEDGSQGDLVTIESLLNRQRFFARVTGPQEVEIYARPPDTGAAAQRISQRK